MVEFDYPCIANETSDERLAFDHNASRLKTSELLQGIPTQVYQISGLATIPLHNIMVPKK
eukprot:gene12108-25402_t